MALLKKTFSPADAVNTLGARLASSGGGLPARLVEAEDGYLAGVAGAQSGVAWDPDGVHLWVSVLASNAIRKVHATTGAVVATFTNNASDGGTRNITGPRWVTRRGNFIYFASPTGAYVGEINTSTLVCRLYSSPVASIVHAVSCVSGKAWIRPGPTANGTYTEVSLSGTGDAATATATGRTFANGYDCVADGTNLYFCDSTSFVRAVEATYPAGGSTTTIASLGAAANLPGYNATWRALVWDPMAQRLVVNAGNDGSQWHRVSAAFDSIDGRYFGYSEMGGAAFSPASGLFTRASFAWSDDGKRFACLTFERSALATTMTNVRVVNLDAQRSTWTWTPGVPVRVDALMISGDLGSQSGVIDHMPNSPAFLQGVYSFKRVRFYYSVSGGASDVEFNPDNDALAIDVPAGQTLTVYAVYQRRVDHPWGPRPWIGSDSGVAVRAFYSRPESRLEGINAHA